MHSFRTIILPIYVCISFYVEQPKNEVVKNRKRIEIERQKKMYSHHYIECHAQSKSYIKKNTLLFVMQHRKPERNYVALIRKIKGHTRI